MKASSVAAEECIETTDSAFASFSCFELRQHRGEVVGLAFSSDGEFMYSADSQGSLALYNASEEDHHVIRVACGYINALSVQQMLCHTQCFFTFS